jgi:hypothetical protein
MGYSKHATLRSFTLFVSALLTSKHAYISANTQLNLTHARRHALLAAFSEPSEGEENSTLPRNGQGFFVKYRQLNAFTCSCWCLGLERATHFQ